MNAKLQTLKYLAADYLAAFIAWSSFFIYRKYSYEPANFKLDDVVFDDVKFIYGVIILPVGWLFFYTIIGNYRNIYRKSRLKELGQTLATSLIGTIIIFFALILDDFVRSNNQLYTFALFLFTAHFLSTAFFRFSLTSAAAHKIHNKIIGFNTLIIGGNGRATETYLEIENQFLSAGNKFVGFLNVKNSKEFMLGKYLPHLGYYKSAVEVINQNNIEEVIIAIDPSEHDQIKSIITLLNGCNVIIKIIPDMKDFLLGSVKMTALFQAPLIQIFPDIMPQWQIVVKRMMDIVISIIAIIILLPLFIFTAIGVKFSSKGPIFYSHKRIGINGKQFSMVKFRSMYENAEGNGVPQLSSKDDSRITPFGKFMRKVRLDEIPQFFTVVKGDMSLVGYRPERQYFIDLIIDKAPHYKFLLKIKPGITSWGQVKYGYAENVDQMVERLKYDILYLENMSIAMDIKILFYTLLIVAMGRGK